MNIKIIKYLAMNNFYHISVMSNNFINYLPEINERTFRFIDCTIGFGGHAKLILEKYKNVEIIGIDKDIEAIKYSQNFFNNDHRIKIFHDNFSNIENIMIKNKWNNVDCILLDLGISSYQIDNPDRGFSYIFNNQYNKLDMRMNNTILSNMAKDILNKYSYDNLFKVFSKIKEIKRVNELVNDIIKQRIKKPFLYTEDFILICKKFDKYYFRNRKNLSSALCFYALRIEVNNEINELINVLLFSIKILSKGGRMIILSYNSIEDGIVKNFFKINSGIKLDIKNKFLINKFELHDLFKYDYNKKPSIKIINKKPIRPSKLEVTNNIRSSSAKMRIIEKI